jgi:hypothetical protein
LLFAPSRMRRVLLAAVATAAAALAPPVLAEGVSENPWKDWENGWSIRPLRGWESRPPSLPGTSEAARVAAGWYPKETGNDAWCTVVVFGRYFGDAVPETVPAVPPAAGPRPAGSLPEPSAPAGPVPPTVPERFPKWVEDRVRSLEKKPVSTAGAEGQPCRLGTDAGWQYEGAYLGRSPERSPSGDRDGSEEIDTWRVVAVGGRRGDFEVGAVFIFKEEKWGKEIDPRPFRASALSLRFLDAKDMARRRDEQAAKEKKAGSADEAWILRVRAKIPAGWRYFRRGETVYVHPEAIPGSKVENLAARLDAMRKKGYPRLFPGPIPPDAPPAVVKITRDERQYLAYGAPEGSLGYFSARQRELVLFHKVADWWDTIDSTAVLFHEGFHQYLNQVLDGFSAHPWFEEGFGDFFAGWRLFEGEPRPGEMAARRAAMDRILDEDAWIPTGTLLGMEWDAFYGRGPEASNPAITYPQSWSLVTFLRSGKNGALVDRYYAALKDSVNAWRIGEMARAAEEGRSPRPAGEMPGAEAVAIREAVLEQAFRGVDFEALEQAWLDALTK